MPATHTAGRVWGGDPGPLFDWFSFLNSTTDANYQPDWEQLTNAIVLSYSSGGFGLGCTYCLTWNPLRGKLTALFLYIYMFFYLPNPKAPLPQQGNEAVLCR